MNRSILLTLLIITLIKTINSIDTINNDEYKLYNKLFTSYSKEIRPVLKWSEPLHVQVLLSLIKVADVIEDYQSMILHVKLQFVSFILVFIQSNSNSCSQKTWIDEYLSWNKSEYNNLESIVVPADKIWIPDLHLFNSAVNEDRIYPLNVEIFSNGKIVTLPISHLHAHCDFEFSKFPFDTQTCIFLIGSMADKSKVNLNITTYIEPRKMFPNLEWKYLNFEATEEPLRFGDISEWDTVKFLMRVQRNSSFYVNLFIWPLVFFLFLTTCLFILPPSCVERITLGVLLLLSLVVMLLMLESYTPKNSFAGISTVAKLILFDMTMITFSILISSFIIGVNRESFIIRVIPKWLKNATIGWLSKLTCKYETVYGTFVAPQNRDEEIEVLDTNQVSQQLQQQQTDSSDLSNIQTLLVLISNQLAMFRMKLQEKELKETNRREWYLIATVLDRFCLIVLSIIMAIGLIGVLA